MNPTTRRSRALRTRLMTVSCVALLAAGIAACGGDDSSSDGTDAPVTTEAPAATEAPSTDAPSTEPPATEAPSTEAPGTDAPADSTPGGEFAEVCAIAEEMAAADLPSAELITQYQAVAPEEIADAVETAGAPIVAAGDDMVALFNALADDDVDAAVQEINAWEAENCGIEHEGNEPAPGTSTEVEDGAAVVDVVATDYEFDLGGAELPAGRTSFVLTNEGAEAHFLLIVKLAEGVTLEDAMAVEDPTGMLEGEWETGLAAGGGDEEVITFDLEPGNYGALCFIPGPDGQTPHAFMGMQQEFTVA